MKNIKEIRFPNTATDENQSCYKVNFNCDLIEHTAKNGEMASIGWFNVTKDNKIIAEIKESVCNIYGEEELPDLENLPF